MTTFQSLPPLADPASLVRVMGKLHRRLVEDLAERAKDPRVEPSLREAWAADRQNNRTGEPFETYRDAFCDQVAASWVLCTVFARTLEDRGYVPHRIAGPRASERHALFRSAYKFLGERDYLLHIFDGISLLPGAFEVFGPGHAALWRLGPTSRALAELLDELRAVDNGQLRFSFGRPADREDLAGASTRYLGDLYQDLNEGVRKRYALLQTPDFVERFLLDNTLDPAMDERGCGVTVLDPACGSGHLLLGAYDRLFARYRRDEPGRLASEVAKLALGQVYGIDLNPYAAAVARFRLLLSYLDKAELSQLQQVPEGLPLQVYVGDSLLAGRPDLQKGFGDLFGGVEGFDKSPVYSLFHSEADKLLYKTKFDVIVANPPYITEKDAAKRETIRSQYKNSATGKYALSAPFAERIFQLGNHGAYTGQITANSFMKREFGKGLVEKVLPNWDLGHVIDTSGAFIPGHGTPTVILFGRSKKPLDPKVPVVMGIRGEPTTPDDPAKGLVWTSIAEHYREIGFENEFISVAEVEREKLGKHPWSIGGGGASELKEWLEERAAKKLGDVATDIGFDAIMGEDDLFVGPEYWIRRLAESANARLLVTGDVIRDWAIASGESALFPYNEKLLPFLPPRMVQHLWSFRKALIERRQFGKNTIEAGLAWFEYRSFYKSKRRTPLSITFAFVATHNHFVLDRGGKVFKQSAPIIKLPERATEDEHLALLGYLNSSTACFWMKQVMTPKGFTASNRNHPSPERQAFEFASSAMTELPLPRDLSALRQLAEQLSSLAAKRQVLQSKLPEESTWLDRTSLETAMAHRWIMSDIIRGKLVCLQEEIDWAVYRQFGIVQSDEVRNLETRLLDGIEVARGDRPFERVRGRVSFIRRDGALLSTDAAECDTRTATALPDDVEAEYQRRANLIRTNASLQLFEQPLFKRLWRDTEQNMTEAEYRQKVDTELLQTFLLTRIETFFQAREPRPIPIRSIADELQRDNKIRAVAEVLTGSAQFDLESLLADLCQQDAVASATCQVYTDAGIETRRIWENVWDLQRREDAQKPGDPEIKIEPPPKYDQKDFEQAATVWRLRGKLDVPKERFIAYPTATPPPGTSGKPGLFFGWAGWDHLQKLQAAIELWQEESGLHGHELLPRATREQIAEQDLQDERLMRDFATRSKLVPILQTMVDLLPWVKQWHDEDGQTASAFAAYITEEARKLEMTLEEVHLWRRPAKVAAAKTRRAGSAGKAMADAMVPVEEKPKKPRGRKPKGASDGSA